MKNRALVIIITLVFTFVSNSVTFANSYTVPEYIKVGLEYYFKEKDSIDIKSQKLMISTGDGIHYNETLEITSNAGFAAYTDNHYYIKLNKDIESYEEALSLVSKLNLDEYEVIPTFVEDGEWMLYIGGFDTKEDLENHYKIINQKNPNIDIGKVEMNLKRNYILIKERNEKIIFENIDNYAYFSVKDSQIELNGRKYRGYLQFIRVASGKMTAVNTLKFNEYLYSVVATEMSASWHIEALKAQAIAARNYAILTVSGKKYKYYDISDTTNDQAYKGYGVEGASTIKAVEDTTGELLMYEDDLVTTFYSASDGGYTEDSENVWTGTIPYLRGVKDIYEKPGTNAWQVEISKKDIRNLLTATNEDIGEIVNMYTVNAVKTDRVNKLVIEGQNGTKTIEKEKIRSFFKPFLGSLLKSRNFKIMNSDVAQNMYIKGIDKTTNTADKTKNVYVLGTNGNVSKIDNTFNKVFIINSSTTKQIVPQTVSGDAFVLKGSGWGHGVGMSQCGARDMAELGFKYNDILTFYYTGTKVVKGN